MPTASLPSTTNIYSKFSRETTRFLSYVGLFFYYHLMSSLFLLLLIFFLQNFEVTIIVMWYPAMLIWKSRVRLIFTYVCGVCVSECAIVYACVGLWRGQERGTQYLPLLFSLWTRSSPVCLGWLPASSRSPWSLSLDARVPGKHSHSWLVSGCWGLQLRSLCSRRQILSPTESSL